MPIHLHWQAGDGGNMSIKLFKGDGVKLMIKGQN
jgi:hypothetical protein